jgi:hypothetical protein
VVDGRTRNARRYHELLAAFLAELGGEGQVTEAERALCAQAAGLTVRAEQLQAAIVRGEAVDDDALTRLANVTTRTLLALRQRRKAPKGSGARPLHAYLNGGAAR